MNYYCASKRRPCPPCGKPSVLELNNAPHFRGQWRCTACGVTESASDEDREFAEQERCAAEGYKPADRDYGSRKHAAGAREHAEMRSGRLDK